MPTHHFGPDFRRSGRPGVISRFVALVIEVTVGLRTVSANTSLWPRLQEIRKAWRDQLVGGTSRVGVFHWGQFGLLKSVILLQPFQKTALYVWMILLSV